MDPWGEGAGNWDFPLGGVGVSAWLGGGRREVLATAPLLSAELGVTSQNPQLSLQGEIPFGITFFCSPSSQTAFPSHPLPNG